ncbi:MAG TPA: hypothetical protein VJ719_07775, partial [Chthoniobacterales bacterium]|nr:hypothetical protein [Chthoniobacterales bacterium]
GLPLDFVTMQADVIKVGALGQNGVLTIGSGNLDADTMLKLYAGGSNGTINFVADVSLNGNSAKIIAANTINIFADVELTINGNIPAKLYTNHPNFASSSGGNDVHSGTIVSATPHEIHPFDANTPPFDDLEEVAASGTTSKSSGKSGGQPGRSKLPPSGASTPNGPKGTAILVADTNQIIQMLDDPAAVSNVTADRPASSGKHKNSRNRGRKARSAADRERAPRMNHSRMDRGRLPAP